MTATIRAMRAAAVALAAGLLLVASGCGSSGASTASLTQDAAALVPAEAVAFVTADANLDSKQWRTLETVIGPSSFDPDFKRDLALAVGEQLNLAVLKVDKGEPDVVAIVKPKDDAKLRTLVAKYSTGKEHYTVEQIGGWSVVADSQASFDAVRSAESGQSLADTANFKAAQNEIDSDSVATAYTDGAALRQLQGPLGALVRVGGFPRWIAARLVADGEAARLELHAEAPNPAPAIYRPTLLRDVPSGAVLAVSFKDLDRPLTRLAADPAARSAIRGVEGYLGMRLGELAPALRGEGAFYVLPGTLLPIFALEVQSPSPQAALTAFQAAAVKIRAKTGNILPLRVAKYGSRVVLTDAPTTLKGSGGSLLDDQTYKDAIAAARVPDQVTFLAYADVQRLAPILQAVTQALGRGQSKPAQSSKLDRLGTFVAFGARSGSAGRLTVRVTTR
jgi:hypothetical protein